MGTQQASFTDEQLATMMQAANDRKNSSSAGDAPPPAPPAPPPEAPPPAPPPVDIPPGTPMGPPDQGKTPPPGPPSILSRAIPDLGAAANTARKAIPDVGAAVDAGKRIAFGTPRDAVSVNSLPDAPPEQSVSPGPTGTGAPATQGAPPQPPDYGPPPSPGVMVPGRMNPDTEERDVKHGMAVAPGVRDAESQAGGYQMDAAAQQHAAGAQDIALETRMAQMKAAVDAKAGADLQRISEDARQITQDKMAKIEMLNQRAYAKPQDLWTSPQILGRLGGFLLLAMGGAMVAKGRGSIGSMGGGMTLASAGALVNGLVNQDIAQKANARGEAAKAEGREINLLQLHKQNLGDEAKAVQATRLAYYDNILQQMDAMRADPKNNINDAAYNNLRAQILEDKAKTFNGLGVQEQSTVIDKIKNKYHDAHMTGGTGVAPSKGPKNLVQTPNGVWHAMPNETQQNLAIGKIEANRALVKMNNEIIALRNETDALPLTREGLQQRANNIAILEEKEQHKLNMMETADGQGQLREGEYDRAKASKGFATAGLGLGSTLGRKSGIPGIKDIDSRGFKQGNAVLAAQVQSANDMMNEAATQHGGVIVNRGYARGADGELYPVERYSAQDPKVPGGAAPPGSRSRDGSPIAVEKPPETETTPYAPAVKPKLPAPHASRASGERKKKDKEDEDD